MVNIQQSSWRGRLSKIVHFTVTYMGSSPNQFFYPFKKHIDHALGIFTPGEKAVDIHWIAVWVGLIQSGYGGKE
jgi:hypothetical protein